MLRSERAFNLAVSIVTAIVLSGASAWALTGGMSHPLGSGSAPTTVLSSPASCRPGFGHGDANHCHSGPRGHATSTTTVADSTSTSSTTATTTTTVPSVSPTTTTSVPCKPGWGYGDTNHCHSGPPANSTPHNPKPNPNPNANENAKKNH